MTERFGPAYRLLSLARELARRSHTGMTLSEMMAFTETSRKTSERMRDTLLQLWPEIEAVWDDNNEKRWVLRSNEGLLGLKPTADELADLALAQKLLTKSGESGLSSRLDDLSAKLVAATSQKDWRRIDPDFEFLTENLGLSSRPGPHETVDPQIEADLRQAMLKQEEVDLHYRARSGDRRTTPRVHPYGFLIGKRHYLVAFCTQASVQQFRLYALSGIEQIIGTGHPFPRDKNFNLAEFASASFGVFQGDPVIDVKLRFLPEVVRDAANFLFHPSQKTYPQKDGTLILEFTCCGTTELCWHLFTWGSSVRIEGPAELIEQYTMLLNDAGKAVS
ncbi:MAG: helix-turn-helix transcriptional regulator [Alphaproteobacteria bacterium]